MSAADDEGGWNDGERIGRYVVVRDIDGRRHALAAGAVSAMCETDDGVVLVLPGGRLLQVPRSLEVVLGWFGRC